MKPSLAIVAAAAGIGLSGCATVARGTVEDVSVVTDPPGASVSSSSGTICTSPCAVSGPRLENIGITVSKAGYVTQTLTSESKPDTAAVARASALKPTADLLGRIIDVQDGSHSTHVPKAFVVKLDPAP